MVNPVIYPMITARLIQVLIFMPSLLETNSLQTKTPSLPWKPATRPCGKAWLAKRSGCHQHRRPAHRGLIRGGYKTGCVPRISGSGGSSGWATSRTPHSSATGSISPKNHCKRCHISSRETGATVPGEAAGS